MAVPQEVRVTEKMLIPFLNFYVGCMMKNYASRFPDRLKEQILLNDALKRFLESANKRI